MQLLKYASAQEIIHVTEISFEVKQRKQYIHSHQYNLVSFNYKLNYVLAFHQWLDTSFILGLKGLPGNHKLCSISTRYVAGHSFSILFFRMISRNVLYILRQRACRCVLRSCQKEILGSSCLPIVEPIGSIFWTISLH